MLRRPWVARSSAGRFAAVLFDPSYKPEIRYNKGALYFVPAICGPRRFQLPVACGQLGIKENRQLEAEVPQLPITRTA
jgi:hypothetical protein